MNTATQMNIGIIYQFDLKNSVLLTMVTANYKETKEVSPYLHSTTWSFRQCISEMLCKCK